MNHHTKSCNKKSSNLNIRSTTKNSYKKKYFSSRSNTQDIPHTNINIKNSSTNKSLKKKNTNNVLNKNNKEECPKKFTDITNITNSLNSDNTSKSNSLNYKNKINQYNEIMTQKDKEIFELEKKG